MPDKAIYVGWSLGGLIATKIAALYPERVDKLICVASSPKFIKDHHWPGIDLAILEKFAKELDVDYEGTLMRFLLLQFYGTTLNKEMMRWLQLNLFLYGKPNLQSLNAGLKLLEMLDLREDLKILQCPALYIFGKLDTLVPARVAATLVEHYPLKVETIVLPKASHALFLTHETEFLKEVKRFSYD